MPKISLGPLSTDPISFLVTRKFPNTLLYAELGSRGRLSDEEEEIYRQSEAYHDELENLDEESLKALYETERKKADQEAAELNEQLESQAWYNQPDTDADFDHWSKMAYWHLE